MAKIKVLLGGGSGLCGSWFSRHLLNKGYDVVILDDFSESYPENLDPRAKFYLVDISDFKKVQQIFDIEKPDYVYSMQAMAAEIASSFSKSRTYQDNVITTTNLLSASVNIGIRKFIQFGSIAIWAGRDDPPFNEKTPPQPLESYGISKLNCLLECQVTKDQFGLDFSYIIPHNFQGKYVNSNSLYRNFLGIAAREALNRKPIPVFGSGCQTRQFSNIKYLMDPFEKLMYVDCPIVNLGSDIYYKVIDIAETIKKIAYKDGIDTDIKYLPQRHEAQHSWCDHSLAKSILDFDDKTDINELCEDVYNWTKQCLKFPPTKKMNFQITNGLPESWKQI